MGAWGRTAIGAALLSLSGCEQVPRTGATAAAERDVSDAALLAAPVFDYRYAYRLPAAHIRGVQDSHAKGCERLGTARCRITGSRYRVGQDKVAAMLTLKLDPALARAYGQVATDVVRSARGSLVDSDIAGADATTAAGRSDTVLAKLRTALADAETGARTGNDPAAAARADRLRGAIATIAEVDPGAAASNATAPIIFTYASGPVAGLGGTSEASFDAAGRTFLESLGGLAVLLAGIGPWIALLLGGALLLRRFVHPREPVAEPPRTEPPHDKEATSHTGGNVIQRWFHRDPEPVD